MGSALGTVDGHELVLVLIDVGLIKQLWSIAGQAAGELQVSFKAEATGLQRYGRGHELLPALIDG